MAGVTLAKYTAVSVTVAAGAILHAWSMRQQLYPTMVLLTTNKTLLVVLGNFALSVMLCMGKLVKVTFLGDLRESEVERLHDRMKETVMEMCIAMTIFREEFSFSFIRYFSFLLFLKVFHWLSSDRVEYLETTPNITASQHWRCSSLIGLLLLVDILFLREAIAEMTSKGPSVLLLFAFEYIILATGCIKLATKYLFYWVDRLYQGNWSAKSICVLYLDLVTELFQLSVYSIFFCIIFVYYGLPFHLLRDLYWSIRNFKNKLVAFIKYRRITTNMNENFEDATAEEIGENSVCIICREEMVAGAAKKLHCGHIFHTNCLRSWLERQQTCPMCRTPVIPPRQQEQAQGPQQEQQQDAAQQAAEGADGNPQPRPAAAGPREPAEPLRQQLPQQPAAPPAAGLRRVNPGPGPVETPQAQPQQPQPQHETSRSPGTQAFGAGVGTGPSPVGIQQGGFAPTGGFLPSGTAGLGLGMGGPPSPLWYQNPYGFGVMPFMPAPFPPPFQQPSPEQHAMAMAAAQAALRTQQGDDEQQREFAEMKQQLVELRKKLSDNERELQRLSPLQQQQEESPPGPPDEEAMPQEYEEGPSTSGVDEGNRMESMEFEGKEETMEDAPSTPVRAPKSGSPSAAPEEEAPGIVGDTGGGEVNELRQRRLNRFSP